MPIFVLKGSSLSISNLSVNLENGELSNPTIEMGYDVYPLWLSNAVEATREAKSHASQIDKIWDGSGNPAAIALLEREVAASMQALAAAAAAIDGFYGSALARAPLASVAIAKSRGRSRHKRILSYFEQRFEFSSEVRTALERPLRDIFEFRDSALHSHGKPEELGFHPRHNISMPKKVVMFRAENAEQATSTALKAVAYLMAAPKRRYKALREHCHVARQWIIPIIEDWLVDHDEHDLSTEWFAFGPSRGMFERKGLLPHWLA